MDSSSGSFPFPLHIFALFIRSFDLHRCAFPVISTTCFAKLALPCPSFLPAKAGASCQQLLSSFNFSPSSSRHCSFPGCFRLPTRCLLSSSHIARQNKRGVVEGLDKKKSFVGRRGTQLQEVERKQTNSPWVNHRARQRKHRHRLQLLLRNLGAHIHRVSRLAPRERFRLTRALI